MLTDFKCYFEFCMVHTVWYPLCKNSIGIKFWNDNGILKWHPAQKSKISKRWLAKTHDEFLIWTCWNSSLVITILEVCLQFIQVQFKKGLFSNHFWNIGFKDIHRKVHFRLDSEKSEKFKFRKIFWSWFESFKFTGKTIFLPTHFCQKFRAGIHGLEPTDPGSSGSVRLKHQTGPERM